MLFIDWTRACYPDTRSCKTREFWTYREGLLLFLFEKVLIYLLILCLQLIANEFRNFFEWLSLIFVLSDELRILIEVQRNFFCLVVLNFSFLRAIFRKTFFDCLILVQRTLIDIVLNNRAPIIFLNSLPLKQLRCFQLCCTRPRRNHESLILHFFIIKYCQWSLPFFLRPHLVVAPYPFLMLRLAAPHYILCSPIQLILVLEWWHWRLLLDEDRLLTLV